METFRTRDSNAEQELGKFLDKYFYPKAGLHHTRVYDKYQQIAGVDVVLFHNDKTKNIDEKAAMNYINRDLQTYAFEISFINRAGVPSAGWLFDQSKKTDYYALVYPSATTSDVAELTEDKFTSAEIFLIKRQDIINYLSNYIDTIYKIDSWMRENGHNGRYEVPGTIAFYMVMSGKLKEAPINVIIPKGNLRNMATAVYKVSRDKTERVIVKKEGSHNA
jgi:hypothetical protein